MEKEHIDHHHWPRVICNYYYQSTINNPSHSHCWLWSPTVSYHLPAYEPSMNHEKLSFPWTIVNHGGSLILPAFTTIPHQPSWTNNNGTKIPVLILAPGRIDFRKVDWSCRLVAPWSAVVRPGGVDGMARLNQWMVFFNCWFNHLTCW